MKIKYSKDFKKQYSKLRLNEKRRIKKALRLFKIDYSNSTLRNHVLKGSMKDKRSISAGGDLRLIFQEYENYTLVLFLKVGSHNQVY